MSKYDHVLRPFVAMMEKELHANAGKGDRPGWLAMSADTCLLEIFYHLGKLQKAVKKSEGDDIGEYAADVANMCMMLADICGVLALADPVPPAGGDVEVYSKPADYWEGYKGHVCYKDTHDLKKMVQHLEGVLDDVPGGELVDHAHVTQLQAEVEQWKLAHRLAMQDNIKLQSELTKAREALQEIISACCDENSHGYISMVAEDALSNQSAPADKGQGEPVAWSYCPECGCEELHHEVGEHKQCSNCHQEWFSDIDYSDVVRGNLQKLKASQPAPIAVVPFKMISLPPSLTEHHAFDVLRDELEKVGVQVKEPKP